LIVAQEKTGYYRLPGEAPPLKKISRKKILRGNHRLVLIGLVFAGFLVGVAITVYSSQINTLGYQIAQLERELAQLRKENNSLNEEIQQMTSLGRIEYLAVNKLGMIKPDVNNTLVVTLDEENQSTGTPGPAADEGQVAGYTPAEKEKSPLLKVFDELLNRLENTIRPGQRLGFAPAEEKDADNTYHGAQENNLCVYDSCAGFFSADPATGLVAAS